MATAKRRAEAVWEGTLEEGKGRVNFGSGAIGELPVTWASRTESADGRTSREELIAAVPRNLLLDGALQHPDGRGLAARFTRGERHLHPGP